MILVINAGSSSLKAAIFSRDLIQITALAVGEIGGASTLRWSGPASPINAPTHATAIRHITDALTCC